MHSVLMDDACILKTHVFMQRWCDIAIVVFIIKSPHLAYSVDNRQHSTSATLNIGLNIGFSEHRNNRPSEQSAKCNIGQALVTIAGSSFVFAVVYRPGSAAVTAAFFDEFRILLEHLSLFAMPYVITGDLNIRFDRPGDPSTLRAAELLDAFGTAQRVAGVTQDCGGTLDVVITRVEDRPSRVDIISLLGGASDHRLVAWPFHAAQVVTPVYRTQRRRSWRKFVVDQFRADLHSLRWLHQFF